MFDENRVRDILREVIDPDIGVNIVDLGMIEWIDVAAGEIQVGLIMTSPACPQSGYMKDEGERLLRFAGAHSACIQILDAPLWAPERMSQTARDQLGW